MAISGGSPDYVEIIGRAQYGAKRKSKRAGVSAEIHFFVDRRLIPESDITRERLERAFRRYVNTGDAGTGFKVDVIDWTAGKRSSEDYDADPKDSLNAGLKRALSQGRVDFGDGEKE